MKITKIKNGNTLTIMVDGKLDTTTAPELYNEQNKALIDVNRLVFDFSNLEYISSAGLRALLSFQKAMDKQGSMVIRGVNSDVMEIFDITGFSEILTME